MRNTTQQGSRSRLTRARRESRTYESVPERPIRRSGKSTKRSEPRSLTKAQLCRLLERNPQAAYAYCDAQLREAREAARAARQLAARIQRDLARAGVA